MPVRVVDVGYIPGGLDLNAITDAIVANVGPRIPSANAVFAAMSGYQNVDEDGNPTSSGHYSLSFTALASEAQMSAAATIAANHTHVPDPPPGGGDD